MKEKLKGFIIILGVICLLCLVTFVIHKGREIPNHDKNNNEPAVEVDYLDDVEPPEGWDEDVFNKYYEIVRSAHYYNEYTVDDILELDRDSFEVIMDYENTGFTLLHNTKYCQNMYWIIGDESHTAYKRVYGFIVNNTHNFSIRYGDNDYPGVHNNMPMDEFYQYMSDFHPHVWNTSDDVKNDIIKDNNNAYVLKYNDTVYSQIWTIITENDEIIQLEVVDSVLFKL